VTRTTCRAHRDERVALVVRVAPCLFEHGGRRRSSSARVYTSLVFCALHLHQSKGGGGGAEIARPDKSAPYRKGGHCETCFSVRVDAHYKFMFDSGSII